MDAHNSEIRYQKIGKLDGKDVYEDLLTGALCIERDFEVLCEMRPEEIQRFQALQEKCSSDFQE